MERRLAWKLCLTTLIVLPLGISAIAFQVLKTPHSFRCETTDEQSNASQRLYCAKARAQQKTPGDLAAAIRLANDLPSDIQPEGKQLVLQWSGELMSEAEVAFQAGEFENAIDLAKLIAWTSPSYDETQRRISEWQQASQKADKIAEAANDQMARREWQQALKTAGQLKSITRAAWVDDRYIALVQQIKADREFRDPKMTIAPPRETAPLTFKADFAKSSGQKPAKLSAKAVGSAVVEPVSLVEATPPIQERLAPVSQDDSTMQHLVEETVSPSDRVIPAFPQVPAPVKEGDRRN
jgi:hypothetical protein